MAESNAERLALLRKQQAELKAETKALQKDLGASKRLIKGTGAAVSKLATDVADQTATGRRIVVDWVGGGAGSAATEGINYLFRLIGEWLGEDGTWSRNIDLIQSIPHTVIGLFTYWIELGTRPANDPNVKYLDKDGNEQEIPYVPTMQREMISEFSKVLAHLGFHNLVRALRFRYAENLDERQIKKSEDDKRKVDLAALQSEAAALRKMVDQQKTDDQKQIDELKKQLAAAKSRST